MRRPEPYGVDRLVLYDTHIDDWQGRKTLKKAKIITYWDGGYKPSEGDHDTRTYMVDVYYGSADPEIANTTHTDMTIDEGDIVCYLEDFDPSVHG